MPTACLVLSYIAGAKSEYLIGQAKKQAQGGSESQWWSQRVRIEENDDFGIVGHVCTFVWE